MSIARLAIQNVRNIAEATLELDPGINLFCGRNGAGKTAALEAFHLLFRSRSFRTTRIATVIRRDEKQLGVGATLLDGSRQTQAKTLRSRGGGVELYRDGVRLKQTSALARLQPIQLLLPSVADLVFGAPATRREWLDWGVFHVKPDYMRLLRAYARALAQRNAALRSGVAGDELDAWTDPVVRFGEMVTALRHAYLESVRSSVGAALRDLTASTVNLELRLKRGWSDGNLRDALGQSHVRDVKSGVTHTGPHRADVDVVVDGTAAATTLSRGQGKIVATAMRIGQAHALSASTPTLFLIDEVGAELDPDHNAKLFAAMARLEGQVVATSARESVLPMGIRGRVFHVKQGVFSPT